MRKITRRTPWLEWRWRGGALASPDCPDFPHTSSVLQNPYTHPLRPPPPAPHRHGV